MLFLALKGIKGPFSLLNCKGKVRQKNRGSHNVVFQVQRSPLSLSQLAKSVEKGNGSLVFYGFYLLTRLFTLIQGLFPRRRYMYYIRISCDTQA